MLHRTAAAYIYDIIDCIRKIEVYTRGLTYERFQNAELVQDGVVRNLELIGEAAKHIPEDIRMQHPHIEWKKICGMRDILVHEYFGLDLELIWDVVATKIPALKKDIKKIKTSSKTM